MANDTGPSILFVEDEEEMREMLVDYFSRQGFHVRACGDAQAARECVAEERPRLAVLDIHMAGEDGLSLLRWLRSAHRGVGVVMLTAASATIDRVVGLELGADDYVAKPCELRELLARVRSVLRRLDEAQGGTDAAPAHRVAFGECLLDLAERRLLAKDGTDLAISPAEFDLLAVFAKWPNRPLSRDQIMEQAHHRSWDVFDRSIDIRIMRLRRKIERNPERPEIIKTVRNVGYIFVSADHAPTPRPAP